MIARPILLVPIRVDALHLTYGASAIAATADFSLLPYVDDTRDINAEFANLAESILSQPFEDQQLPLAAGTHLHWAMPDALTHGVHRSGFTEFPPLPDRWLIVRSGDGAVERWVVESNYLHPPREAALPDAITFPVEPADRTPRFRHLGRVVPASTWTERQASAGDPRYLDAITAVGYGDPTFAAFYPNCRSVFGFHDGTYAGVVPPDGLRYDVIGWYGPAGHDCLQALLRRSDVRSVPELLDALAAELHLTISEPGALPDRIACYARVTMRRGASKHAEAPLQAKVAVGNTGGEALAAYLAAEIDPARAPVLEEQLNAILLDAQLAQRKLDLGPLLNEARHESAFTPVPSGQLWTIVADREGTAPASATATANGAPPARFAEFLVELNRLQRAYERAHDELLHLRRQLFFDWYKYMLCAYPPEGAKDEYPAVDEALRYIEARGLAPLEEKQRATGELGLERDAKGQVRRAGVVVARDERAGSASVALPAAGDDTAAARLARAINGALAEIEAEQIRLDNYGQIAVHLALDHADGGELLDSSPRKWRGTVHGAVAPVADKLFGRCLSFPGTPEGYAELIDPPRPAVDHLLTVEAWVYIEAASGPVLIIGKGTGQDWSYGLFVHPQGNQWLFRYGSGAALVAVADPPIRSRTWYHVAGVFEGTRAVLYVDGKLAAAQPLAGTPRASAAPLRLAHGGTGEAFCGRMAHVRIYDRALSADEIRGDLERIAVPRWRLIQKDGPRYYEPNEPVVLMVGDGIRGSERHGEDGRLRDDGLLECQVLSLRGDSDATLIFQDADTIRGFIDTLTPERSIALTESDGSPWHPLALQWRVEVMPVGAGSNLTTAERRYAVDYITRNFTLPADAADLAFQTDHSVRAADVYSGSALLSPHAPLRLGRDIVAYLKKHLLDSYYRENGVVLADRYRDRGLPPERWDEQYLDECCERVLGWYLKTRGSGFTAEAQAADPLYTALRAYRRLLELDCLSQSLGGFNEALLMRKQTLQLRIDDPLGFTDYLDFTHRVREAVGPNNQSAPSPQDDFNPIRAGHLRLVGLRLVDSFGQVRTLDWRGRAILPSTMRSERGPPDLALLPPRVVQPLRLHLRWLAAEPPGDERRGEGVEATEHPGANPICGWLLPNHLDRSLMVYDQRGEALGSLDRNCHWTPAPGGATPLLAADLRNPRSARMNPGLRRVAAQLLRRGAAYLERFLDAIDSALENIDPEGAAQQQGLALLVGRPIAVVRAAVSLELAGPAAINQSWQAFRQDLALGREEPKRQRDGFPRVRFPVRLGEYKQLNDGLVGYFVEEAGSFRGGLFHAPQSDVPEVPYLDTRADEIYKGSIALELALEDPPRELTLLVDPRGLVHATTGVAPTKAISLPPEQYKEALEAISVTFLTAPVLVGRGGDELPLPEEPGYEWTWLERRGKAVLQRPAVAEGSAKLFSENEIREGWLVLRRTKNRG